MATTEFEQQAKQIIEQLQSQVTQLTTRANAADEEHRRIHAELERSKIQLIQANASNGKGEFKLIDPKTMIPEVLDNTKIPWRRWSEDTRAYVSMLSPTLAKQLKAVEGMEVPLTPEDINNAAVPEHHATQLSRYLLLRSEANANTLIKASQERDEHPLETWRILSHEYDPKGLGSELAEIQNLTAPSKL